MRTIHTAALVTYSVSFSRSDAGGLPFELTVGADKSATPGQKPPPRTLFMAAVSDPSAVGGATGAVSALVEELVNFGATCETDDKRRQIGTAYEAHTHFPCRNHSHLLAVYRCCARSPLVLNTNADAYCMHFPLSQCIALVLNTNADAYCKHFPLSQCIACSTRSPLFLREKMLMHIACIDHVFTGVMVCNAGTFGPTVMTQSTPTSKYLLSATLHGCCPSIMVK